MVTLSAMLWTDLCCLCCQLSGVGLSSVIKAFSRVYSLLFTLLASALLCWIQFNYSTAPVMSILFIWLQQQSSREKPWNIVFGHKHTQVIRTQDQRRCPTVFLSMLPLCLYAEACQRVRTREGGEGGGTFVQRYLSLREAHKRWCKKRHQVEYKPPLLLRNANKNPLLY